jgi:hypothetical protein
MHDGRSRDVDRDISDDKISTDNFRYVRYIVSLRNSSKDSRSSKHDKHFEVLLMAVWESQELPEMAQVLLDKYVERTRCRCRAHKVKTFKPVTYTKSISLTMEAMLDSISFGSKAIWISIPVMAFQLYTLIWNTQNTVRPVSLPPLAILTAPKQ